MSRTLSGSSSSCCTCCRCPPRTAGHGLRVVVSCMLASVLALRLATRGGGGSPETSWWGPLCRPNSRPAAAPGPRGPGASPFANLDVALRSGQAAGQGLPVLLIVPPPLPRPAELVGVVVASCPLDNFDVLRCTCGHLSPPCLLGRTLRHRSR